MKTISYQITNPLGMHARPAAFVAQACVNLPSQITFSFGGKTADGANVLQLIGLGARNGSVLEISAEGGNEEEALQKVLAVLEEKLNGKRKMDVLRIAFFGAKDYDKLFFSKLAEETAPTIAISSISTAG